MEPAAEEPQKLPKLVYLGIMFGMVIISVIVISANGKQFESEKIFGKLVWFKCIKLVIILHFKWF